MCDAKKRLEQYISHLGISTRAFERDANLAVGFVRSIRQTISPAKQKSISTAFPDLNMGWLLTGEGEMLRSTPSVHQTMSESPGSVQIAHNSAERININNNKTKEKGMESSEFLQRLVERLMGSNESLVANNTELTKTNSRLSEELSSIRATLEQYAAKLREMESALGCADTHTPNSAGPEVKNVG